MKNTSFPPIMGKSRFGLIYQTEFWPFLQNLSYARGLVRRVLQAVRARLLKVAKSSALDFCHCLTYHILHDLLGEIRSG
ncbi:MAG: hypothetical protein A3D96_00985 [Chlamydiae bacterium RIFCSPHIGHO2_12_FULL_44_59]|nr:MAG: hypothetical protein A2796_00560 [Chlamydiae bacterium RIFCSPHIGHO2_01_FULL_44_39]OGN57260.1 MAG: hypothetical protein A3C42_04405 [Chlamydiae bacterium RIFCSPHIGHO2_02_FULL_45_9]OGN60445.1 MAG: hypothetical protein A3D96_00985 [Chlamydiae bacterium RIFCSPHIGHO2_12_FULL_44_59]OGN66566.1 MAG: hypothetical protein A2978_05170 [Chlamydiae bacterium RIFCSPLOWO2_01_FULL_44_52]OGN69815.1 MAG: hypothetical protein A3I67_06925 [Chlamydiae bacterium RIFCSPLOWO2_02_FULL_45_22]OGN70355.1 MAG: hyp